MTFTNYYTGSHNSNDWPKLTGLRFTPYAWNKMVYMLHEADTEVGGWGVSSESDLLLVHDFQLVKQKAGPASIDFDQVGMAQYACDMAEQGYSPNECMRIWIHTHPGFGCKPSRTDESTFREVIGQCDWGVMFIVSETHDTYAKLVHNVGPRVPAIIPVSIDWEAGHPGSDEDAWSKELDSLVEEERYVLIQGRAYKPTQATGGTDSSVTSTFDAHKYRTDPWDDYELQQSFDSPCDRDEWVNEGREEYGSLLDDTDTETGLSVTETERLEQAMQSLGLTPPLRDSFAWQDVAMYVWDYAHSISKEAPDVSRFPEDLNDLEGALLHLDSWLENRGRGFLEQWSSEWWDAVDEFQKDWTDPLEPAQ